MMADPNELDRLNWNETRMGRDAIRTEATPRFPEPDDGHSAPVPQADAPELDAVEVDTGGVEVPAEEDDNQDDIKIG